MKIQNNVNQNNPAFEARIKLTGSRKLAEELANAFEAVFLRKEEEGK